jgi:hypothetical protein|tara:strand:- start:102 stop:1004 length:903 start_codon:yes stop_codon:yes gene_type:complete
MANDVRKLNSRRKYTEAYNKTGFQTGYSQASDSIEPTPLPYSEQKRPGEGGDRKAHPIRKGLDPAPYDRQTQAPVSLGTQDKMLFTSVYPFHLVPRYTSANVIQREAFNFATTTLATNQFVDVLVINVSRAIGSNATTPQATPSVPPIVPTQVLSTAGESMAYRQPTTASTVLFPTGSGGTIASASATSTMSPASSGEFYKIASFGHSELPTANAGVTYQIWVDGRLMMEWADFQWSPVIPRRDQWDYEVPLFVEKQIVFRVINETGVDVTTGSMEAAFVGWSEQKTGFLETDKIQLETN